MISILWVGLGGALGASSRFLVSEWSVAVLGRGFPYGTLMVNVLGSLAMGVFLAAMSQELIAPVPWRQLIVHWFFRRLYHLLDFLCGYLDAVPAW